MSFISVLSKIGKVVKTVAGAGVAIAPLLPQGMAAGALMKYGPLLVSIAMTLGRNVLTAEATKGSSSGPAKKIQAMAESVPEVIRLIESAVGHDVLDEERMKRVADKGIEFIVELLDAVPSEEK